MVKVALLTVFSMIAAVAYVEAGPVAPSNDSVTTADHWICSCFQPAYDRGCCDTVGGTMDDGNVCDIPGRSDIYLKYEACCTEIQGRHKCK